MTHAANLLSTTADAKVSATETDGVVTQTTETPKSAIALSIWSGLNFASNCPTICNPLKRGQKNAISALSLI